MSIPISEIIYAFALPSWKPQDVTVFQGFAPGLIELAMLLPMPVNLPADITELTMEPDDRLARRRSGNGGYMWSPINVETLTRSRKPTPEMPFTVVFTANKAVAKRVKTWRSGLRIRPLHVSIVPNVGALRPDQLTVDRLQRFCVQALKQAKQIEPHLSIGEAMQEIESWKPLQTRPSSIHYHAHNVTAPNEMVLVTSGEEGRLGDIGHLNASPPEQYVEGITETARAVLALHARTEDRPIYHLHPPRPDLVLFAPTVVNGMLKAMRRNAPSSAFIRASRALERQRGHTLAIPVESEDEAKQMAPLLGFRGAELKTQTLALGLRTSSDLAATIRLPPSIDRTAGVVGQLARHMRTYDDDLPDRKTAKVLRVVQEALLAAIPPEHLQLIRESKTGVKIIGNAPLEWLPVDGLPLFLHSDVSRIPVTPGNIMMEQLRTVPPLYIPAVEFKNYLVLSMFEKGDPMANFVERSLAVWPGGKVGKPTGTLARPKTPDELVAALNAFNGPVLIIDSHGEHHADPNIGGLIIGGKPFDVWSLRNKARIPPIVLLSACDTHPFDRSHATVANGFLSCGAVAVLATALPIRARDATIFLSRLMRRAIELGEILNGMGRSLPWTNVVGGALRMQLASDIVKGLTKREMIPANQARAIQLEANKDINPWRVDWLPRLAERCRESGRFDEAAWTKAYNDILAASDVIRYVHLGNPECITITDGRVVQRITEMIKEDDEPAKAVAVEAEATAPLQ